MVLKIHNAVLKQIDDDMLAIVVGAVCATVVVRTIEKLASDIRQWANGSPNIQELYKAGQLPLMGSWLNISSMVSSVGYMVLTLVVMYFVIVYVIKPLINTAQL